MGCKQYLKILLQGGGKWSTSVKHDFKLQHLLVCSQNSPSERKSRSYIVPQHRAPYPDASQIKTCQGSKLLRKKSVTDLAAPAAQRLTIISRPLPFERMWICDLDAF